jgi:hypothetical protein
MSVNTYVSLISNSKRTTGAYSDIGEDDHIDEGGLGGKSIGKYGSFVYVVNQIFGPGMVAIPIVFQQCKWSKYFL